MISKTIKVEAPRFERETGWAIRPEGACRDDRCVRLPQPMSDAVDVGVIAELLKLGLTFKAELIVDAPVDTVSDRVYYVRDGAVN